jgi:hypothetical protein
MTNPLDHFCALLPLLKIAFFLAGERRFGSKNAGLSPVLVEVSVAARFENGSAISTFNSRTEN